MDQVTTIIPSFIDPPKAGKKLWSVKTQDNEKFSAEDYDAAKLQVGARATIKFETNIFNTQQGPRQWKKITSVDSVGPVEAGTVAQKVVGGLEERANVPPHVSNWIAHAIMGNHIQGPDGIRAWVEASYRAVGLQPPAEPPRAPQMPSEATQDPRPEPPPFDDEIPDLQ